MGSHSGPLVKCALPLQPRWQQTIPYEQTVSEDFVNYLSHEAIEIEVWGATDNHLWPTHDSAFARDKAARDGAGPEAKQAQGPYLCGERIKEDLDGDGETDDESDSELADVEALRKDLHDARQLVETLRREARATGELATGLVKLMDGEGKAKEFKDMGKSGTDAALRFAHGSLQTLKSRGFAPPAAHGLFPGPANPGGGSSGARGAFSFNPRDDPASFGVAFGAPAPASASASGSAPASVSGLGGSSNSSAGSEAPPEPKPPPGNVVSSMFGSRKSRKSRSISPERSGSS